MKLLLDGGKELARVELDVDRGTSECRTRIDAFGYRIEGPAAKALLEKDPDSDGLRLRLEVPDLPGASVLIERDDVKELKALMNKDAIKFMIKALM